MILLTILIFLAILGLLIFVHELGHFVMAKRAGMKVEEFGFGFPPRLFGIKRGETIYSINWIPLGGFVKITGEDGSESEDPRNFGNKNFWQRFSVLIAGVTMNVILAWILISIGLGLGIPTELPNTAQLPKSAIVKDKAIEIRSIGSESPAEVAGLKAGDLIVKVNGQSVASVEQIQTLTKNSLGKPVVYTITRDDETFDKILTPRENPPEGQGPLGIALASIGRVAYPWYETLFRGFWVTLQFLVEIVKAFVTIIGQWLSGQSVSEALSGPVGIAVLTRDMARLGFIYVLQFTAILSINLAVINAVPFPALDGGRVLFLIIEKFRGKKFSPKAEQIANTLGFALLLLLMVVVTVRDVGKFDLIERIKNLI